MIALKTQVLENNKPLLLLLLLISLSGCGTLAPLTTAFQVSEAAKAVEEDKKQPTTIETVITKNDGKIVIASDSPRSIVGKPTVLNPEMKPKFDTEKAVSSIPTWLILIVILTGALTFINTVRHFVHNKKMKRSDEDDTYGIDNDGWRCTDGGSVQVHGQRPEEQAEATRNADADEPTNSRTQTGRQRVSIQVGRRSSK